MYLLCGCVASANLCGSMTWPRKKILARHTFVPVCRVAKADGVAAHDNICSIIAPGDAAAVPDLRAQRESERNSPRRDPESDVGRSQRTSRPEAAGEIHAQ